MLLYNDLKEELLWIQKNQKYGPTQNLLKKLKQQKSKKIAAATRR